MVTIVDKSGHYIGKSVSEKVYIIFMCYELNEDWQDIVLCLGECDEGWYREVRGWRVR